MRAEAMRAWGEGIEVTEHEAVARHRLARLAPRSAWRNIGPAQAKVWNSPFSAHGSTPAGRSASRSSIEAPAGEARGQLARIDAGDVGLEPAGDHLARQLPVSMPHRGNSGAMPVPASLLLAIAADVLQEQVAERHGLARPRQPAGDERAHDALVVLVGAGIGDRQHMQRQAGRRAPAPPAARAARRAWRRGRRRR